MNSFFDFVAIGREVGLDGYSRWFDPATYLETQALEMLSVPLSLVIVAWVFHGLIRSTIKDREAM